MRKKFTMLLAALLAFVGVAKAQTLISGAAQLSNEKVYTVKPANNASTGAWSVAADGSKMSSTRLTGETPDGNTLNQRFAFLEYDGHVYLYSLGAKKFVKDDGAGQALTETVSSAHYITFDASNATPDQGHSYTQAEYPMVVYVGGAALCSSAASWHDTYGGIVTNWNNKGDSGNAVAIVEHEPSTDELAILAEGMDMLTGGDGIKLSTEDQKHFYLIKNLRVNKYANYDGVGQFSETSETNVGSYWYFMDATSRLPEGTVVPEGAIACYIYNAATDKPVQNEANGHMSAVDDATYPARIYFLREHTVGDYAGYAIQNSQSEDGWNDDAGSAVTSWNYNTDGSIWEITPAQRTQSDFVNDAKAAQTAARNFIALVGESSYYLYTDEAIAAAEEVINALNTESLLNAASGHLAIENALSTLKATEKSGVPAAGDIIMLKNRAANQYLTDNGTNAVVESATKEDKALWKVVAGEKGIKLQNCATNRFLGEMKQSEATVTVDAEADAKEYVWTNPADVYAAFNYEGSNQYGHRSGSNLVGWWDANAPASQWLVTNVRPLSITYLFGDKTIKTTSEYAEYGQTVNIVSPLDFTTVASCTVNDEALEAVEGAYSFEVTAAAEVVVTLEEALPFTPTTVTGEGQFAEGTEWYVVKQRYNDHIWMRQDDNSVKVASESYDAYNDAHLWCFVGNVVDGFKVYNKAAGASLSLDNSEPAKLVENNTAKWFVETSAASFSASDLRLAFKYGDSNNYANLQSNGLKKYGTKDSGSTSCLIPVSEIYAETAANWEKMFAANEVGSVINENVRALVEAYKAEPSKANYDAVNTAIAALTDADRLQLKQDAYYMIVSADGRFFANQDVEKALYSDGTDLKWATRDNLNRAYFWQLEKISDKWHLKNYKDMMNMAIEVNTTDKVVMMRGDEVTEAYDHDLTFTNIADTYTQWNIYFEHNAEKGFHALGHNAGKNQSGNVCLYAGGADSPSAWRLIEVTEAELVAAAKAELNGILNTLLNGYYDSWNGIWRDQPGVNNYTLGEWYAQTGTLETYYNTAKDIYDNEASTDVEVIGQIDLLTAVLADGLTINQPEAGKFYRLRCVDGKNYLSSKVSDERYEMEDQNHSNPDHMFLYDGSALLSYSQGFYLAHHNFNAVGEKTAVTFSAAANGEPGQYNISFADGESQRYIYGKGNTQNNHVDSGTGNPTSTDNNGYNWWLEEVTSLPVAVSAAGYATLYAPVALAIPSDVEVYTATINKNGTTLDLTQVTGTIPANTGVLLKAVENTYNFNITADVEAIANNAFTGSCAKSLVKTDVKVYTLQNKSNGVGFYKYATTTNKPINQFRAWIEVAEDASAPAMFSLDRGEGTTGIESVEASEELVIFDLAGRRVQKMEKGIYIVNGRKVVVK